MSVAFTVTSSWIVLTDSKVKKNKSRKKRETTPGKKKKQPQEKTKTKTKNKNRKRETNPGKRKQRRRRTTTTKCFAPVSSVWLLCWLLLSALMLRDFPTKLSKKKIPAMSPFVFADFRCCCGYRNLR